MAGFLLKVKELFEPKILQGGLPKDDEVGGSNSSSGNGDTLLQNSGFATYLNPARAILAEMVGTFILVLCICGIITSTRLTGGGPVLLEYATTAGLTIVVVVYSIGSISGAHVNPALTIAFAAFGFFPWSKVPLYILAQVLGSILATLMGEFIYGTKSDLLTTRPSHGCQGAFMVELVASFIVVFVIASVTRQSRSAYLRRITEPSKVIGTCNCFKEFP
ncbi:probable aquaporin NIP7-1 [Hibiscus syriacus]|uniref:probable aquaporin NIP7-1 n=1 Tax=Hibiscus syriacus TaxID=106335 RepID=UPI0019224318|nr:probable aquaporin NIP7-1 [Hibiscus syriacus]